MTSDEILIKDKWWNINKDKWRNINKNTSDEILIKDKWRNNNKTQVAQYWWKVQVVKY